MDKQNIISGPRHQLASSFIYITCLETAPTLKINKWKFTIAVTRYGPWAGIHVFLNSHAQQPHLTSTAKFSCEDRVAVAIVWKQFCGSLN